MKQEYIFPNNEEDSRQQYSARYTQQPVAKDHTLMDNDKCHIKAHDCSCVPFGAAWFELYDHQKGTINKERLFDQLCSSLTDTGKQMHTLVSDW